jgi:hypothetical protein
MNLSTIKIKMLNSKSLKFTLKVLAIIRPKNYFIASESVTLTIRMIRVEGRNDNSRHSVHRIRERKRYFWRSVHGIR